MENNKLDLPKVEGFEDLEGEAWRKIPILGLENYEVSDKGRVRSWAKPFHTRTKNGPQIMNGQINTHRGGYRRFSLYSIIGNQRKQVCYSCHRLVMLAFVGPAPEQYQVAHEDGNPLNNDLKNLNYKTQKENEHDKKRHGTDPRGERHGGAILTEQQVIEIYLSKESGPVLAKRYGLRSRQSINMIRRGKTWGYLTKDLKKE